MRSRVGVPGFRLCCSGFLGFRFTRGVFGVQFFSRFVVWGSAFRGYGFRVCDFTLLVRDFAFGVRGFQGFAFVVLGLFGVSC